MLPAAAQGAIGIDCLLARADIAALLEPLNHVATFACVMAERAFLAALGGTCHSPVAAQGRLDGGKLWLTGQLLNEDGSESYIGESDDPAALARELLAKASPDLAALFAP
jgi:hydroxymethylbilane synthase